MIKKLPIMWTMPCMTWECTQQCSFCYNDKKHIKEAMPKNTIDQMVNYVVPLLIKHEAKVHCTIALGGEPLLEIESLDYMYRQYAGKSNVRQTNVIYSNCDLIDKINPKYLEFCNQMFFHFRELNFDEIDRRVKVLRTMPHIRIKASFVLNVFNMNRIEDLAKYCLDNEIKPKIYYMEGLGLDVEYKTKLKKSFHKFLDICEKSGKEIHLDSVIRHFMPSWKRDPSYTLCGRGLLAINPNGDIRTCIRGDKIVGTVWDNEDYFYGVSENRWAWHHDTAHRECKTCDLKQVCQGDCPNEKMLCYGTYYAKSPFCDVWKEILPRAIKIDAGTSAPGDEDWIK